MKHVHGGNIYKYKSVLDFSANINPLGMPESIRRAVSECAEKCLHYPDPDAWELRQLIAEKEKVPAEQIICGNGAAELIYLAARAVCPSKVLFTVPSFAEYEEAFAFSGAEKIFYEMKKEAGFRITKDYLEMLTPDLEMAFLCNPNNPTGLLIAPQLLEEIIERCRENGIFLVLDECFLDFCAGAAERTMKKKLEGGSLMILKAFTKMYSMPGLRLGYAMTADTRILLKMSDLRQPWSVSVPAQEAGKAALKEKDLEEKTAAYVADVRETMIAELQKRNFEVCKGEANYLFFEAPVKDLSERMIEKGILIRDCSNYRSLQAGYYRIAVRPPQENAEFLKCLDECLDEWSGKE